METLEFANELTSAAKRRREAQVRNCHEDHVSFGREVAKFARLDQGSAKGFFDESGGPAFERVPGVATVEVVGTGDDNCLGSLGGEQLAVVRVPLAPVQVLDFSSLRLSRVGHPDEFDRVP